MTSEAIPNVTSSQESGVGPSGSELRGGMTVGQFGQALALANLSARQARDLGLLTSGTSGLRGSTSLRSACLQESLENRLRPLLNGSDLFKVIWKPWTTPWGTSRLRPRVQALSTVGIEGGSLPTPSGTSNHGKNHVSGRLDEWGGSSNPFRGTSLGKVHCFAFELWVMGYNETWARLMPPATQLSRRSRRG